MGSRWSLKMNYIQMKKIIFLILIMYSVTQLKAQEWEPFPWVSQKNRDAGFTGGEGGQIITDIEVSTDGQLVMVTTDVGGTKISTDSGRNYRISSVGLLSEGGISIAIDPKNKNRIIIVGTNHFSINANGIYISKDMGKSWEQKLPAKIAGSFSYNDDQLAYDASSYNDTLGYCTTAYWSRDRHGWDLNGGSPDINPNIYKTTDGGETWIALPNSADYAGGNIAVHPENGYIYAANENGFFVSTDGGNTWITKTTSKCYDVSITRAAPDYVYYSTTDGIYCSKDSSETFSKIASVGAGNLPSGRSIFKISVNQINPDRILVQTHPENGEWYDYTNYTSSDGGTSWTAIKSNTSMHFYPVGLRGSPISWDPGNEFVAYINIGDCVYRSTDGGFNYSWYNDGLTNVMGDYVSFSTFDNDIAILATQDYSASFTTNGGQTWKWTDPAGTGWGGNTYGSYTPDGNLIVIGHSTSWGGPVQIYVSTNGGNSFTKVKSNYSGPKRAYGSATDKNILFYGAYRGTGATGWAAMVGCDAVLTHNPTGNKELYGRNGTKVVKSVDNGKTWNVIASPGFDIADIAYDHLRNRVYVAGQRRSGNFVMIDISTGKKTNLITKIMTDSRGLKNINTVATDPVNPSVVYAAGWSGEYSSNTGTVRSTDGGLTWESISDGRFGQGGFEVMGIRVNTKNRNAYVATMCRGIHRFNPMYNDTCTSSFSIDAGTDTVIEVCESVKLSVTGGDLYTWNPKDGQNSVVGSSPTVSPQFTTTYRVSSFDSNGCAAEDDVTVNVTANLKSMKAGLIEVDGILNDANWNLYKTTCREVSGIPDNAVAFGSLWDNEYLYVGIEVVDKDPFSDSGNSLTDDDAIEVFVDAENNKSASYGLNDLYIIQGKDINSFFINKNIQSISRAVSLQNFGYTVEIAIPWSELGILPAAGLKIGFDIANPDDDNGGKMDHLRTWAGDENNDVSTVGFGTMTLEAQHNLEVDNNCGFQNSNFEEGLTYWIATTGFLTNDVASGKNALALGPEETELGYPGIIVSAKQNVLISFYSKVEESADLVVVGADEFSESGEKIAADSVYINSLSYAMEELSFVTPDTGSIMIWARKKGSTGKLFLDNFCLQISPMTIIPQLKSSVIDFCISPNPSKNGQITISFSNSEKVKIQVFDILGKKVYDEVVCESHTFSTSFLKNGIYIVHASALNNSITKKLVVN